MTSFSSNKIQLKSIDGQIALDKALGIVECFVAGIGNRDSVGDIIVSGAFNESLKRRKPRVVWGHSWNDPIGKVLEIYEVGPNDQRLPQKMKQAGIGGLFAKVQFNLTTQKGREAFNSVAFYGSEQEWSIGYKTLNATFDPNRQANVLTEVELYEVSPVLHGANQLTGTISVKGADAKLKNPDGGLTAAGRKFYNRTEGANLKPGVKGPADTPEKMRRKGSFLTRFFTNPSGPLKDSKGRPTRLALSATAWGEPVPQNAADARRLAAKGRRLLERYEKVKGKSLEDYCEHFLDGEVKCACNHHATRMPHAMGADDDDFTRRPVQEIKPNDYEYEDDDDFFEEGLASELSPSELARLQTEVNTRTRRNIKILKATENLIWLSMNNEMFMLPYHHEISTDQFMFGKPQRVSSASPMAQPKPRRSFPAYPHEPGMDDMLRVVAKNEEDGYMWDDEEEKSLVDTALETIDFIVNERIVTNNGALDHDAMNHLRTTIDLLGELHPKPVEHTHMVVKCALEDMYEVKSVIDPVVHYHGAVSRATENGIEVLGVQTDDFVEAMQNAVKALGGRIGGAGKRAVRFATARFDPHAIDGDNDGLVQEGTAFERPGLPNVPDALKPSGKPKGPSDGWAGHPTSPRRPKADSRASDAPNDYRGLRTGTSQPRPTWAKEWGIHGEFSRSNLAALDRAILDVLEDKRRSKGSSYDPKNVKIEDDLQAVRNAILWGLKDPESSSTNGRWVSLPKKDVATLQGEIDKLLKLDHNFPGGKEYLKNLYDLDSLLKDMKRVDDRGMAYRSVDNDRRGFASGSGYWDQIKARRADTRNAGEPDLESAKGLVEGLLDGPFKDNPGWAPALRNMADALDELMGNPKRMEKADLEQSVLSALQLADFLEIDYTGKGSGIGLAADAQDIADVFAYYADRAKGKKATGLASLAKRDWEEFDRLINESREDKVPLKIEGDFGVIGEFGPNNGRYKRIQTELDNHYVVGFEGPFLYINDKPTGPAKYVTTGNEIESLKYGSKHKKGGLRSGSKQPKEYATTGDEDLDNALAMSIYNAVYDYDPNYDGDSVRTLGELVADYQEISQEELIAKYGDLKVFEWELSTSENYKTTRRATRIDPEEGESNGVISLVDDKGKTRMSRFKDTERGIDEGDLDEEAWGIEAILAATEEIKGKRGLASGSGERLRPSEKPFMRRGDTSAKQEIEKKRQLAKEAQQARLEMREAMRRSGGLRSESRSYWDDIHDRRVDTLSGMPRPEVEDIQNLIDDLSGSDLSRDKEFIAGWMPVLNYANDALEEFGKRGSFAQYDPEVAVEALLQMADRLEERKMFGHARTAQTLADAFTYHADRADPRALALAQYEKYAKTTKNPKPLNDWWSENGAHVMFDHMENMGLHLQDEERPKSGKTNSPFPERIAYGSEKVSGPKKRGLASGSGKYWNQIESRRAPFDPEMPKPDNEDMINLANDLLEGALKNEPGWAKDVRDMIKAIEWLDSKPKGKQKPNFEEAAMTALQLADYLEESSKGKRGYNGGHARNAQTLADALTWHADRDTSGTRIQRIMDRDDGLGDVPERGLRSGSGRSEKDNDVFDRYARGMYEDYKKASKGKPKSFDDWYDENSEAIAADFDKFEEDNWNRLIGSDMRSGMASRAGRGLGESREIYPARSNGRDSSAASYVRYDAAKQEMIVQYKKGNTYTYGGITKEMADAVENSDSLGSALADIKRQAEYTLRPDGTVNGTAPSLANRLGDNMNRLRRTRGLDKTEEDVFDAAIRMANGDMTGSPEDIRKHVARIEKLADDLWQDDETAAAGFLREAMRHSEPGRGLSSRVSPRKDKLDFEVDDNVIGGTRNGVQDVMKRQSRNQRITAGMKLLDDKLASASDGKFSISKEEYNAIMDSFAALEAVEPDGHGIRGARNLLERAADSAEGKVSDRGIVNSKTPLHNNGAPVDITPRMQGELVNWGRQQRGFNNVQALVDKHERNNGTLSVGEWRKLESYRNAYGKGGSRRGLRSGSGDAVAGGGRIEGTRTVGQRGRTMGATDVDTSIPFNQIKPANWEFLSLDEKEDILLSDLTPGKTNVNQRDWDRMVREVSLAIEERDRKQSTRPSAEERIARMRGRIDEAGGLPERGVKPQQAAGPERAATAKDAKKLRQQQQSQLMNSFEKASARVDDAVANNAADSMHGDLWGSVMDIVEESDDLTVSKLESLRDTLDDYLDETSEMDLTKGESSSVRSAKALREKIENLLGQYEDDPYIEQGDTTPSVSTGRSGGLASGSKNRTRAENRTSKNPKREQADRRIREREDSAAEAEMRRGMERARGGTQRDRGEAERRQDGLASRSDRRANPPGPKPQNGRVLEWRVQEAQRKERAGERLTAAELTTLRKYAKMKYDEYKKAKGTVDRAANRRSGLASGKAGRMEIAEDVEFFKKIYDSLSKEISQASQSGDGKTSQALRDLKAIMERQDVVKISDKMTAARRMLINQDELDAIMDALMVVLDRQMETGGSRTDIFAKLIEMMASGGMATFIDKEVAELGSRKTTRTNSQGRSVQINVSD